MTGYGCKKLLTLSFLNIEIGISDRVLRRAWHSVIKGRIVILKGKQKQENYLRDAKHKQNLEDMLYRTIESLAHVLERRDPYTCGHQQRVAALASAIAKHMG
jgi:HD-GYP domain-containing protein (c-di-GMP phosphodiesterase class II)